MALPIRFLRESHAERRATELGSPELACDPTPQPPRRAVILSSAFRFGLGLRGFLGPVHPLDRFQLAQDLLAHFLERRLARPLPAAARAALDRAAMVAEQDQRVLARSCRGYDRRGGIGRHAFERLERPLDQQRFEMGIALRQRDIPALHERGIVAPTAIEGLVAEAAGSAPRQ